MIKTGTIYYTKHTKKNIRYHLGQKQMTIFITYKWLTKQYKNVSSAILPHHVFMYACRGNGLAFKKVKIHRYTFCHFCTDKQLWLLLIAPMYTQTIPLGSL